MQNDAPWHFSKIQDTVPDPNFEKAVETSKGYQLLIFLLYKSSEKETVKRLESTESCMKSNLDGISKFGSGTVLNLFYNLACLRSLRDTGYRHVLIGDSIRLTWAFTISKL